MFDCLRENLEPGVSIGFQNGMVSTNLKWHGLRRSRLLNAMEASFWDKCAPAVLIVIMEISGKYFYGGLCQQNKPFRFLYAARYGSP